jgi:RNA polymerase sigma-70 factor, ECF subfamily
MSADDPPNWREIVEKHSLRVFRVAMRILGNVQDAEDVAQEVFTEAYQKHRAGPIQSWTGLLVRLSTLRSLDLLRRRKPNQEFLEHDKFSSLDPFQQVAANELASRLRLAVGQLPDQQATVFVMAHYEQMTREEIASYLSVSTESVSTSLYKARKRLSEILTPIRFGE